MTEILQQTPTITSGGLGSGGMSSSESSVWYTFIWEDPPTADAGSRFFSAISRFTSDRRSRKQDRVIKCSARDRMKNPRNTLQLLHLFLHVQGWWSWGLDALSMNLSTKDSHAIIDSRSSRILLSRHNQLGNWLQSTGSHWSISTQSRDLNVEKHFSDCNDAVTIAHEYYICGYAFVDKTVGSASIVSDWLFHFKNSSTLSESRTHLTR